MCQVCKTDTAREIFLIVLCTAKLLSRFSRVWLCATRDGSLSGSTVPGILHARTLEWKWMMLKLKLQYFGHKLNRADSLEKTLMLERLSHLPAQYSTDIPGFFAHLQRPWLFWSPNSEVILSSVAQSCPTLCDPSNHSTPGFPVHHQPMEFT